MLWHVIGLQNLNHLDLIWINILNQSHYKACRSNQEECRSNYGQNLSDIYSMSIVTTQPKLIENGRVVKCRG